MRSAEILVDAFGRVRGVVDDVLAGLTADDLAHRPGGSGNSIGWLVWHLTRIQDDHVADAAGLDQLWTAAGWVKEFGLPFDESATGYGQSTAEVDAVRVASAELLGQYHAAVHEQTVRYVGGLTDAELDRVVDPRWDPPVTLGVRLVSVASDDLQHAGQAAFVRGLLRR
jgi:uncharacterized damage-inducible protein DinB